MFPEIHWGDDIKVVCKREGIEHAIQRCGECRYLKGLVFGKGVDCGFPDSTSFPRIFGDLILEVVEEDQSVRSCGA